MGASHIFIRGSSTSRRPAQRVVAAAVVAVLLTVGRTFPARADTVVVIRSGDTLSAVAVAHGTTVEDIVARNGLASGDMIRSGQRLLVPGGSRSDREGEGGAVRTAAELRSTEPTAIDGGGTPAGAWAVAVAARSPAAGGHAHTVAAGGHAHIVAPGETLFAIAMAYGTTVDEIVRANGLGRSAFVRPGQRIVVAGATRSAPAERGGTDARAAIAAGDVPAQGVVAAHRVTADDAAPAAIVPEAVAPDDGARRIVVDLSDQTVSAYSGGRLVNRFIASTGTDWTPTPLGTFAVYARWDRQRMTGPGYDLPNVPFVQYFTGSYAIHGAYWHQSFGVPVSHGCVNLQPADAAWLYDWADLGTPVIVQR